MDKRGHFTEGGLPILHCDTCTYCQLSHLCDNGDKRNYPNTMDNPTGPSFVIYKILHFHFLSKKRILPHMHPLPPALPPHIRSKKNS